MRAIRIFALLLGLAGVAIAFQNCGEGFQSQFDEEFASLASAAPVIQVTNAPGDLSNQRTVTIGIEVIANQYATVKSVTCVLDDNAPADCGEVFMAVDLLDGDHVLKINATDSRGNVAEEVVLLWRVDATAPVVTFNQAPPDVTGAADLTVTFTSNEPGTYQCALDGVAIANCASPLTLQGLAEGNHTLVLRAVDLAMNLSQPLTKEFVVDRTAPVINLTAMPAPLTNATTATFSFNGTDNGQALSMFSCQLDAQEAAPCNGGSVTYTGLAAGSHTFTLVGRDLAGNNSAPLVYSWAVDLTAPATPTVTASVGATTTNRNVTFQFSSTDANGINRFECQLDSLAVETCPVGQNKSYANLALGEHRFRVRAIDQAGNASPFAAFNWVIEAMPTPTPTPTPSVPPPSSGDILFSDDSENYTSPADAVARGPWASFSGNVSISRNYAHSGTQSFRVCYVANEAQAFMEIDLGQGVKHLFLRWWELRERAGDFPGAVDYDWAGEKLNRIRSRNIGTTGLDYPLGWGAGGAHAPFGAPGTSDGGEISWFGNSVASQAPSNGGGYITGFNYNMPRGEWHMFEVEMNLGTQGQANGEARIWVDNVLRAERKNVMLLPFSNASLEVIWMGGWYSGNGNPSGGPACRYFDDVVVSRSRIGSANP